MNKLQHEELLSLIQSLHDVSHEPIKGDSIEHLERFNNLVYCLRIAVDKLLKETPKD